MELFFSPNTCSMAEIGNLTTHKYYRDSLNEDLAAQVADAEGQDRKMIIANVSAEQAKNKELLTALKKHGFKKVGSYFGNTDCYVHVYIRGLKRVRK